MVSSDNDKIIALKNQIVTKINGLIATHNSNASAHSDIRNTNIHFGQVDNASTSTVFTATVPNLTALVDGTTVMLKNGVVTSETGFTINVNGLGAKPVYSNLASATQDTTIFNINYTMLFVYDSTRISGGCWICYRGYDSNTNTIGYQIRTNSTPYTATDKGYRYRLWLETTDNKYMPVNTSTSTNATANRSSSMNTREFWIGGNILYNSTNGTTNANATMSTTALWKQYTLALGYSFNNTGSALVMNYPSPVYMVAEATSNGKARLHTPYYTQTLPSSEDGLLYIYLGHMYSETSLELALDHPVYEYKNGGIRLYQESYTIGEVDDLLDGKSNTNHTHTKSQITDFPSIPTKTSDLTNDSGYLTSHQDISGKANTTDLGEVAFSNDYEDLDNLPTIPSAYTHPSTHPSSMITDNNTHSNIGNTANTLENIITNIDTKLGSLANVDLIEVTSSLGTASANTMNKLYLVAETTGVTNDNYEVFVTVRTGTSGNYSYSWEKVDTARIDLSDYLTTANAQQTYVAKENGKGLSSNDYTTTEKNKLADLHTVATSGSYNDLADKPTIPTVPTNVSAFTNDSGYLTSHQDISGKEDINNKSSSITTDTGSTSKYPTVKAIEDYAEPKKEIGTFTELIALINNTPAGKTLTLDKDYKNSEGLTGSTSISNEIHIDGNGHILDFNYANYYFYFNGEKSSIENWIIEHFQYTIFIIGFKNIIIDNCIFRNSNSNLQSTNYLITTSSAVSFLMENCQFYNIKASSLTLVLLNGNKQYVKNCIFYNNLCYNVIFSNGGNKSVNNTVSCVFDNNRVYDGVIKHNSNNNINTIVDCIFNNNIALSGNGSAINCKDTTVLINNKYLTTNDTVYPTTLVNKDYLIEHQDISGKVNTTDLGEVAFSNDYNDLDNLPTIPTVPTNVSAFTNDSGYLTSHQDISGKANTSDLGSLAYEDDIDLSTHDVSELTDTNDTAFTPKTHSHSISDVTNLQTSLNGKQATLVSGTNIKTINNESLLGSGDINTSQQNVFYGTCGSSASGQTKVVSVNDWSFTTGNVLFVNFSFANTYDGTPYLQIGEESKPIRYVYAGSNSQYHWRAGEIVAFVYGGDYMIMVNEGLATTTYYGVTKLSSDIDSTSEILSATPKAVKTAYDLANGKADKVHTHGNISTEGKLNTTGTVDISRGDLLLFADATTGTDQYKIKGSSFIDALNDLVLDLIDEGES